MLIPIIIFSVAALILSGVLVAVSFHVARYRYHNDASIFVFTTISIIYLLITAMTFIFFRYSPPAGPTSNVNRSIQTINL